jgi:hypothetical protein
MTAGEVMAEEKNFENKVKWFLKDRGCYIIKYWGGGDFTKVGVPDILICCKGYFIGVEVKSSKGIPSAVQISNLKRIRSAGGYGILLYPKDWDYFRHFIENLKCGNDFEKDLSLDHLDLTYKKWLEKYKKKGVLM